MRLVTAAMAPVEQWCFETRIRDVHSKFHLLAGLPVTFDAEQLAAADDPDITCGGRAWLLTSESRELVARILGRTTVGRFVCEHQLELGD